MIIEKMAFNLSPIEEQSLEDIKNLCLRHFASNLKYVITSKDEKIRKLWNESSTLNYKVFQDLFSSSIKYNSKNIVFEETLTSNSNNVFWNVKEYCMSMYNLEYVEPTDNTSGYFRYRKNRNNDEDQCCCNESFSEKSEEALRNFYYAFGVGEFPYIEIEIIRLGNKDHYFYAITR